MGSIDVSGPGGFRAVIPSAAVPDDAKAALQLSVRQAYMFVLRLRYPDAVTEARGRYLPIRKRVQLQKIHNQLRNPRLMAERESTAKAVLNDRLVGMALQNYFGGA